VGVAGGLTTNSDDRKNLSWQTFRIGRGVKKTDAIGVKKMNNAINGIWLFAGEGALYNASPSPDGEIRNYRDKNNKTTKQHPSTAAQKQWLMITIAKSPRRKRKTSWGNHTKTTPWAFGRSILIYRHK
jgi:hypothetical protein